MSCCTARLAVADVLCTPCISMYVSNQPSVTLTDRASWLCMNLCVVVRIVAMYIDVRVIGI